MCIFKLLGGSITQLVHQLLNDHFLKKKKKKLLNVHKTSLPIHKGFFVYNCRSAFQRVKETKTTVTKAKSSTNTKTDFAFSWIS